MIVVENDYGFIGVDIGNAGSAMHADTAAKQGVNVLNDGARFISDGSLFNPGGDKKDEREQSSQTARSVFMNFRANESRMELAPIMPSAAENALCEKTSYSLAGLLFLLAKSKITAFLFCFFRK